MVEPLQRTDGDHLPVSIGSSGDSPARSMGKANRTM
jgi:hypothetical protein